MYPKPRRLLEQVGEDDELLEDSDDSLEYEELLLDELWPPEELELLELELELVCGELLLDELVCGELLLDELVCGELLDDELLEDDELLLMDDRLDEELLEPELLDGVEPLDELLELCPLLELLELCPLELEELLSRAVPAATVRCETSK